MGERAWPHMMQFEILLSPLLSIPSSMFCTNKHMFSQHHFFNHQMINGYCAYIKWYSCFGWCSCCWSNSCRSCFVSHFFLRNGDNDYNLGKGHMKLRLTPWIWFHPSSSKIFGCLHQHANDFLHRCANITWSTKGFGGPLVSIIYSFYRQNVLVAFREFKLPLSCIE